MPTPIRNPKRPINEMLRIFAAQAEETMVANNLKKQRIWPTEVWPGYAEEVRNRKHPTGEGAKSFKFTVTNDDPFHAEITMTFLSYMRYVDLGVGAGTEVEDVDRAKKAHFARRYGKWIGHQKRVQRPHALMEARHVLRRMRDFSVDFFGYEGAGYIINSFVFDDDDEINMVL